MPQREKHALKEKLHKSLGIDGSSEKLELLTVALVKMHLFWDLTLC